MEGDEQPQSEAQLRLSEKKGQFRAARRVGFILIGVLVLVLILLAWVQGGGFVNGPTTCDPSTSSSTCPPNFFIPLPQLAFAILFGFLLLNLTSVAFSLLEIKAAAGGEQKYLIARHSFTTAMATSIIMAFFLLVVAFFGPAIDAELDYSKRLDMGYNSPSYTVRAPFDVVSDYTGSSFLEWVEVNSSDGGLFTVLIYDADLWQDVEAQDAGNEYVAAYNVSYFHMSFVDMAIKTVPESNRTVQDEKIDGPADEQHYSIVIVRRLAGSSEIIYRQSRVVDPAFVSSVTEMLLLLIVFNAASAPAFYITRNKWRAYGQANY